MTIPDPRANEAQDRPSLFYTTGLGLARGVSTSALVGFFIPRYIAKVDETQTRAKRKNRHYFGSPS
jgi:hypothetical protein